MSGAPDDVASVTGPGSPARGEVPAHGDGEPSSPVRGPVEPAAASPQRRRRRAVRPGAGVPDPSVDLRSADDSDLGWQAAAQDNDDERLRRDVPPHW